MTRFFFEFPSKRELTRVWIPTLDRRCPLEAVWIDAADVTTSPIGEGDARCQ